MISTIFNFFKKMLPKGKFETSAPLSVGGLYTSSSNFTPSKEVKQLTRYCFTIRRYNTHKKCNEWMFLSPDENRNKFILHGEPIYTTDDSSILVELLDFMKQFGPIDADEYPVDYSSIRIVKFTFSAQDLTDELIEITDDDKNNLVKRYALSNLTDQQAKLLNLNSLATENKILKSADPKQLLTKASISHIHYNYTEALSKLQ